MIKELSAKDCVWLRIKERLRTKDEDGYPYSYLSLCARHILMLAGLNCCEHDSQFDFGFYHIQLHSLQFFLAGHAGINAMANTNFSRQNYRKALKELEDGKWAIINTHVPVVNAKTRKISYKSKLGTIIDFSCLLTAEEIKEISHNFSERVYNNHQPKVKTTNGSIVEELINTKEIGGQKPGGNHQKGDTITIKKTNLVMNGSTSPLHGDGNHQNNHQLMAQTTNGSVVEEPINTKEIGDQKPGGNHQKGDTITIKKTNLVMNGSTSPLHGDGNHQNNHQLMAQTTNGSVVEEPINTKEIGDQKPGGNHQKGDTITIKKTNLVMNGSTSPLHGDGNHQNNHQLMAQRTNSSIVEEPINTKEVSGQKSDGNHQKGDTTTIQKTKKYCCCRYDELKDSVVPTDKEGYPLCPHCGKFLELNRKKQFYGHPDWATGPCRKTFSAKTLIVNWETKRKKEQQQQQHERSTKFATEKYIKDLSQRAAASHRLIAIKELLPYELDKTRQQLPAENEKRTNYEELKICKRNRENY